ncbi:hypothetical protein FZ046_05850 [Mycolicibacterium grossiae]|uniref:hypothetical protein n=1 Tax=Mycolicibacterium grossiae TaxID=1552759 RepID=UPI0011F0D06E|nr:hypothetical protein [Mycolicibacterium grossiae]QEM44368.1 hypothetical protein FZ046_05850 [Mycolicibacterium grossiae]
MPDAQSGGAAGEPAVGHQEHVLAETRALDGAGDRQHLPHARAALRALVADDDDVAVGDGAVLQRVERRPLALEDPCGALEDVGVEARRLHHRTLGRQRPVQDRDAAGGVDRVVHRPQHLAVRIRRLDVGEVLGHRLPRHGQAVAVQQTGVEQRLHHDGDAADLVDVLHHVPAEGLDVGQVRDALADAGEVLEAQLDVGLPRDGEQVQHRVGGAAERHHHGDGVLERLLGEDVARGDAAAQHLDHRLAGAAGVVVTARIDGDWRCAARQRHSESLGRGGHGVGGVHAATRALAGADRALDDVDVLARHEAAGARTDRLEGVDDRDLLLGAVGELGDARHDRAVVEEDVREVEPRGRHQHAGDRLVAAGEQHGAVEALGLHHGLDAVGDDLAGHQGEVHALVAHRDAVGHGDGAELQRITAAGVHAGLHRLREPLQRHVARGDLVPGRADADLRLGPVVVAHAHGAQHPAGGGLLQAVGDVPGAGFDVGLGAGGL